MSYPHRSIETYVHDHRIGVLVEFGMPSEFTEKVPEVKSFMKNMALHVAASAPLDVEDLMTQSYIKDPDKNIASIFKEMKDYLSEEIEVIRFVRWEVGDEDSDQTDPPRSPAKVVRLAAKN